MLSFWIVLVLIFLTERATSGTESIFVLSGGDELGLSTPPFLRTENKSPNFCINFETERLWVEASNPAMLIDWHAVLHIVNLL
jgi:hypothetical protein